MQQSKQIWVQNLNQIIPKFGRMLQRGRTEPSRILRPNIRPMFGLNRKFGASLVKRARVLYFLKTELFDIACSEREPSSANMRF